MQPITIAEYAVMLRWHDWWYEMTDDFDVWKRGAARSRELLGYTELSEDHATLYWAAHRRYM